MLLKLTWTLVMLFSAAYMQARSLHILRRDDWDFAGRLLPRGVRALSGYAWLFWAGLFVVTGFAVWLSWLWALALLAISALPPIIGVKIFRNSRRR